MRTMTLGALAAVGLSVGAIGPAHSQEADIDLDSDGFTVESGDVQLTIGGRVHLDNVAIESDALLSTSEQNYISRAE